MKSVAYFKNNATGYGSVLERCSEIISKEFRVRVTLGYIPDLLMVAEDSTEVIVGVMILHYTESTRAWEIGTTSVVEGQSREKLYEFLVRGAYDSISVLQAHGVFGRVWLVKPVRHVDLDQIRFFTHLGFGCPTAWTSNFLSDDGYVPFDPFSAVLMKKEVVQT